MGNEDWTIKAPAKVDNYIDINLNTVNFILFRLDTISILFGTLCILPFNDETVI